MKIYEAKITVYSSEVADSLKEVLQNHVARSIDRGLEAATEPKSHEYYGVKMTYSVSEVY